MAFENDDQKEFIDAQARVSKGPAERRRVAI